MENSTGNSWRKCSSCKKDIPYSSSYYQCSVSTCNSKRTGYVFCSVPCFERHLPGARHKDAAAVQETAPKIGTPSSNSTQTTPPQRRVIVNSNRSSSSSQSPAPKEILIVASKLKAYIKNRSDMSTSADVMNRLSDKVRRLCDDAMDEARAAGRKTVLDRDFK